MATKHEGHCGNCQKTTSKHCLRCVQHLNKRAESIPLTFYCSTACQKADFASHKTICSARLQLFRGAALLQQAFHMLREVGFDLEISSAERIGDELHFHMTVCDRHDKGPIYAFPDHLISDQKDKEALLTYSACGDALKQMHPLTCKVFEGIATTKDGVTEVMFGMKKEAMKVRCHEAGNPVDGTNLLHQVLAVALQENESYVVDLAGAQYHQYAAVVPWDMYAERIGIVEVRSRHEFGHEARRDVEGEVIRCSKTEQVKETGVTWDMRTYAMQAEVAKALKTGVADWEEESDMTVADMLREKAGVFKLNSKKLLTAIKSEIESYVANWKIGPEAGFQRAPETSEGGKKSVSEQPEQPKSKTIAHNTTTHKPTTRKPTTHKVQATEETEKDDRPPFLHVMQPGEVLSDDWINRFLNQNSSTPNKYRLL